MFAQTLPLLIFLFPLAYSPGPGNSFFAALAAQGGLAATWPASFGYHLATAFVTVAVGLGFGQIMLQLGPAFEVLRYAGALWLLWIAWRIARSGPVQNGGKLRAASALDGAVLLVLNPKAWLIIALMFTQFLPEGGTLAPVLWITLVFTLNNFAAFTLWSVAGEALGRFFAHPAQAVWPNRIFALTLACVALWMVWG
ncbi:MAG: LysE family translocator [Roseinatronobacter sp.]